MLFSQAVEQIRCPLPLGFVLPEIANLPTQGFLRLPVLAKAVESRVQRLLSGKGTAVVDAQVDGIHFQIIPGDFVDLFLFGEVRLLKVPVIFNSAVIPVFALGNGAEALPQQGFFSVAKVPAVFQADQNVGHN